MKLSVAYFSHVFLLSESPHSEENQLNIGKIISTKKLTVHKQGNWDSIYYGEHYEFACARDKNAKSWEELYTTKKKFVRAFFAPLCRDESHKRPNSVCITYFYL